MRPQHPADFSISLLRDPDNDWIWAHINVVRSAVYVDPKGHKATEPVHFSVIVEPLYLFAIPKTSLSLFFFLVVLIGTIWILDVPNRVARGILWQPGEALSKNE